MPRNGTTPSTTADIGVGFGLLAGLVGVGQWVLTARDFAARLAALQAAEGRAPGSFIDATNVYRGNAEYWLVTALIAAGVMLVLCLLAAFTAGWVSPHRDDGLFAAWVAAGIAMLTYTIASGVAMASIAVPIVVLCSCPIGLIFGCLILALAPVAADLGADSRVARSRGHRTP